MKKVRKNIHICTYICTYLIGKWCMHINVCMYINVNSWGWLYCFNVIQLLFEINVIQSYNQHHFPVNRNFLHIHLIIFQSSIAKDKSCLTCSLNAAVMMNQRTIHSKRMTPSGTLSNNLAYLLPYTWSIS